MTPQDAADIWSRNVRAIRLHIDRETDAIYDRWLRTNMECVERDNLMRMIRAREDAAIAAETQLYYANRAIAVAA